MATNQTVISWQAPEFRHYFKSIGWYAAYFACAVLIIGFFIIEKDIFGAVSIGILAIIAALFTLQKPQIIDIELNSRGIKFGTLFYPYKQLKYFWVVDNDRHNTVNFVSITYLNNNIILELQDQDPHEVRELLLQHLPEHHETNETMAQAISHRLKF